MEQAFQRVAGWFPPRWPDPAYPQQLHLDIRVHDAELAEHELIALGATRVPGERETGFRVFTDPAGHPFCICSVPKARAETAFALAGTRQGVSEAPTRTGCSVHGGRSMLPDYGPRRVSDLAAPISSGIATRVTQSRCQIQLTITSDMHTNSLSRIIMCLGNALLSADQVDIEASAGDRCAADWPDLHASTKDFL